MGPILVNTKQKVAVVAAGLVVATTGFLTEQAPAAQPPAEPSAVAALARQSAVAPSDTSGGSNPQTTASKR